MKKKIAIYSGQLYMGGIERVLINYLEKLSKEPELDITLIIKQNIPEDNVFLPEVPKNIKIVYVKSEEMCRRTDKLRKNKKNIISRLQYQWALFYERIVMKQWVKSFFEENNFDIVIDFDIIKAKAEDYSDITLEDEKLLKNDFFIAVSRLVGVKNRVGLVEIYGELKKKGIKKKLYILGEGEDRPNIERKIKELNLEEDVLLLGQKKNPFPYMKAAKMFLHTSRGEGLPTVFIESMLCDTIVVAYDCPTGPREILEDGKAGGLVPLGNQKTFEEVILNILSDKELEKSIKSEMYKKMDEFNYEYIRKDLFKLF